MEVKIEIYEGEKFIIERIDIAGNNVTNDSVIRSEMLVDEGDPYSVLLVNKSLNKLRARGIFGNVKHEISEGSTPDLKVYTFSTPGIAEAWNNEGGWEPIAKASGGKWYPLSTSITEMYNYLMEILDENACSTN